MRILSAALEQANSLMSEDSFDEAARLLSPMILQGERTPPIVVAWAQSMQSSEQGSASDLIWVERVLSETVERFPHDTTALLEIAWFNMAVMDRELIAQDYLARAVRLLADHVANLQACDCARFVSDDDVRDNAKRFESELLDLVRSSRYRPLSLR